tara:strand:+ start:57 stop:524 length:468 start_codon:yes stop_codon:yes gene_type:complete
MFSVNSANRPNYYKYLARLNFEAAKSADKEVGFWPGYEIAAPPPVMALCAHSIELSLKSYLLEKGVDEESVRRFNHDLTSAWKKCVELGANADGIHLETLAIISDLLKTGRLRYGDESKLGKVPVFGPLSELCERCLELCGAPTKADILTQKEAG